MKETRRYRNTYPHLYPGADILSSAKTPALDHCKKQAAVLKSHLHPYPRGKIPKKNNNNKGNWKKQREEAQERAPGRTTGEQHRNSNNKKNEGKKKKNFMHNTIGRLPGHRALIEGTAQHHRSTELDTKQPQPTLHLRPNRQSNLTRYPHPCLTEERRTIIG